VNAARYSLVADIRISSSDSEKSIAQSVATPGGAASCEMAGPNAVDPANLCQEPPCPCNEAKPGHLGAPPTARAPRRARRERSAADAMRVKASKI
jgi:hypothetical protein